MADIINQKTVIAFGLGFFTRSVIGRQVMRILMIPVKIAVAAYLFGMVINIVAYNVLGLGMHWLPYFTSYVICASLYVIALTICLYVTAKGKVVGFCQHHWKIAQEQVAKQQKEAAEKAKAEADYKAKTEGVKEEEMDARYFTIGKDEFMESGGHLYKKFGGRFMRVQFAEGRATA